MDLFAGIFALLGLVVVLVTGVLRGVPLAEVLARGLLALLVGAIVGWIVGRLGRRIVLEGIAQMDLLGDDGALVGRGPEAPADTTRASSASGPELASRVVEP